MSDRVRAATVSILGLTTAISLLVVSTKPTHADPILTDKGQVIENFAKRSDTQKVQEKESAGPPRLRVIEGPPFIVPTFSPAAKDFWIKKVTAIYPDIQLVGDPDPFYDCHAFTFKSSQTLVIENSQVQKILDDQGWKPPTDGKAKVGDIVVYRKDGEITHSGIVHDVDSSGKVTKVESKWGSAGRYIHGPDQVPHGQAGFSEYGSYTVLTGGKPLKDPPSNVDFTIASSFPEVTLKESVLLRDDINIFPVPRFRLLGDPDGVFDYFLDFPEIGLDVSPGDTITLFANGITGANPGATANPSLGGWMVESMTSDSVTWEATSSVFLTGSIFGFQIDSLFTTIGDAIFLETVAGSYTLTKGPIPASEPNSISLLAIGCVIILGICFHRVRVGEEPDFCIRSLLQ